MARARARIDPLRPIDDPLRSETVPNPATLASATGVDDRGPSGILPGTGGLTGSELLSPELARSVVEARVGVPIPTEPARRFVLHPAWIVSRTDGQRHYIDVGRLAALYGLRLDDPDVVIGGFASSRSDPRRRPGDVDLWPRFDGSYEPVR